MIQIAVAEISAFRNGKQQVCSAEYSWGGADGVKACNHSRVNRIIYGRHKVEINNEDRLTWNVKAAVVKEMDRFATMVFCWSLNSFDDEVAVQ